MGEGAQLFIHGGSLGGESDHYLSAVRGAVLYFDFVVKYFLAQVDRQVTDQSLKFEILFKNKNTYLREGGLWQLAGHLNTSLILIFIPSVLLHLAINSIAFISLSNVAGMQAQVHLLVMFDRFR